MKLKHQNRAAHDYLPFDQPTVRRKAVVTATLPFIVIAFLSSVVFTIVYFQPYSYLPFVNPTTFSHHTSDGFDSLRNNSSLVRHPNNVATEKTKEAVATDLAAISTASNERTTDSLTLSGLNLEKSLSKTNESKQPDEPDPDQQQVLKKVETQIGIPEGEIDGVKEESCDFSTGEWVRDPDAPYYTNATCPAMYELQNCMKFGKPGTSYKEYRWKPDGCDLPKFDPNRFLELVRGKSISFVGDSFARNQMQSLICLLSGVVNPLDLSPNEDKKWGNQHWLYKDYNFKISFYWAPFLVRSEKTDPNNAHGSYNLYLDEYHEKWTSKIEGSNYIIMSAGQWFMKTNMLYENGSLIGCGDCNNRQDNNMTQFPVFFGYQKAIQTALGGINRSKKFKGLTFLATINPTHFEGGAWNEGGDCVRTRPFKRNETDLPPHLGEMRRIQVQELKAAEQEGRPVKGIKFMLIDITNAMLMRPDGHPGKYGRQPGLIDYPPDCVHWCTPGPVDTWNEILLQLIWREEGPILAGNLSETSHIIKLQPEQSHDQTDGLIHGTALTGRKEEGKRDYPSKRYVPATSFELVDSANTNSSSNQAEVTNPENCELFTGEWIPDPNGPYYTNKTCHKIQEEQNCMLHGKPDTGYVKWRWKPDGCDLPIFDPHKFLDLVRGKSIAFIGDSMARNQMQSCLLSRSLRITKIGYRIIERPQGDILHVYLDKFNKHWTSKIQKYDYVVISAGPWFPRDPSKYYENGCLIGCYACKEEKVADLGFYVAYQKAYRTALRAIRELAKPEATIFVRTISPRHFENGTREAGGDCVRTRPFKRGETSLEPYAEIMRGMQLEELINAQEGGGDQRGTEVQIVRCDTINVAET
ncbi:OLC1v1011555C1 [Oldenlandia corymbosa var. corymbosa]|uniref:OLC1v1011555C1 n=1 Tax=Oldenlandia corymbosa var. corymbosa TaxID=529605 RepID=A0AAV1DW68_OLDCO|nr:OLC1v1011555C1 [Oldenlandia corymbosa var. corymbosa]